MDGLVAMGVITEDMADTLYANYKTKTPVYNSTIPKIKPASFGEYDNGSLIPGRNGWTISYKDGTTRKATPEEVKAGKSLKPKPIF